MRARGFARDPERDRLVDEAGAGRDRVGARAPRRCRPRRPRRRCRPAPTPLEAPCAEGAAESTVTGRGASFSAQNRPGEAAADDDDRERSWR